MPLTLRVDGDRWRNHLRKTVEVDPRLVPVAKGNGYGFTVGRLARRSQWLGVDTIAVGTYADVEQVRQRFPGRILIMQPWRPFLPDLSYDDRLIHTVGRLEDLAALANVTGSPRVVLEALTSMRRHGFPLETLSAAAQSCRGVRVEGHAVHLPLGGGHQAEVDRCMSAAPAARWYVSHLAHHELDDLRSRHPDVDFRPRVGTSLWLGDRVALRARATVLDAHRVRRGDQAGYRRRRFNRAGTVLVISGGTAHGIALEAPTAAASTRQRAVALARGGLEATGHALSPYVVGGRARWFVEPPHMQVSLVFLPADAVAPAVGDEVEVRVRFTTTHFDHVVVT